MTTPPILGAHVSIAGGVNEALPRASRISVNCFQIFTKNNNQWKARSFHEGEAEQFRRRVREGGFVFVVTHGDYLTNLASAKPEVRSKSKESLAGELERCRALGIEMLVMHPGSHGGDGVEVGIDRVAESLKEILPDHPGVRILLETTAGQGTGIGVTFEELAEIYDRSSSPERLGVCYDTCHTFAAGYDIRTEASYEDVMKRFDEVLGFGELKLFHLNDSKKGVGQRIDRHQHIGWGEMGLDPFRMLMNDDRFSHIPKIIETPKEGDPDTYDPINLNVLRGLLSSENGE
jgi:deoxyribonuclease-4